MTKRTPPKSESQNQEEIRLNRYIANAGVCSRRDADLLIKQGTIKVNGVIVDQLGSKVKRGDKVQYNGKLLSPERQVYVLLNKPKDFITTMDDPEGRKTVMDLVKLKGGQRVYPVGRLDRKTTGLLLLTNDGDLAKRLSHPSGNVGKLYEVELDHAISVEDFSSLEKGIKLEDGFIKPDEIAVVSKDRRSIGVRLHSGKNRIVRRMFQHLGYEIARLDRVMYAGLTKKDIPRGKWRFLSEKEVIQLKYLNP